MNVVKNIAISNPPPIKKYRFFAAAANVLLTSAQKKLTFCNTLNIIYQY